MPSPFAIRPMSTSDEPPERPLPVQPAVEGYEGENLPYRGTELHGVPMFDEPRDVPAYSEGREVEYEPEDDTPDQDPIPVRIVSTAGRELRKCRIFRSFAPPLTEPKPTQVIGANEARTSVQVKNNSADAVYIGHDAATADDMSGWVLEEGEVFSSSTQGPLWAIGTHATDQSPLSVSEDYAVTAE